MVESQAQISDNFSSGEIRASSGSHAVAVRPATLRERLEFVLCWLLVTTIGALPRNLSRKVGAGIGAVGFHLLTRLRRTGLRNLELAYPEWPAARREATLRCVYRNLGYQLAEFCQMPHYTLEQASSFIEYQGLEHYLEARARGKGVLVLTGHLGAWELSSFYHSLSGFSMGLVIRRLDNPLVDAFVNRIRCLHGNRVIHKDDFARGLISSMRAGETVGILMDTNMTPPQGVFVPFFGVEACTASGLARVALKTGAAVLPGFLLWDESRSKYVLRFGEQIPLIRTGAPDDDIVANTAAFAAITERSIREFPDQWLWMHRRWKTRPANDAKIY
jgi:Kdo2-lipid IVA lauroyltransferase/acyltransferase